MCICVKHPIYKQENQEISMFLKKPKLGKAYMYKARKVDKYAYIMCFKKKKKDKKKIYVYIYMKKRAK